MEKDDDIIAFLEFTIAVSHVQRAIQSRNLSLKVDFLFQSFLVITVHISVFSSNYIITIKINDKNYVSVKGQLALFQFHL